MSNRTDRTLCALGLTSAGLIFSLHLLTPKYPLPTKDELLQKVERMSDIDKNGRTSLEEWRLTYEDLGLKYTGQFGRDLTEVQLKEFIRQYEK